MSGDTTGKLDASIAFDEALISAIHGAPEENIRALRVEFDADNNRLRLAEGLGKSGSAEQDIQAVCDFLDDAVPCLTLVRLAGIEGMGDGEWAMIAWMPNDPPAELQMLSAGSRLALRSRFSDIVFKEYEATTRADVNITRIVDRLRNNADATHQGSVTVGAGTADNQFAQPKADASFEASVRAFANEGSNTAVVGHLCGPSGDHLSGEILEDITGPVALRGRLPAAEACFVMLRQAQGRVILIVWLPESARAAQKMKCSAFKEGVIDLVATLLGRDVLTTSVEMSQEAERVEEYINPLAGPIAVALKHSGTAAKHALAPTDQTEKHIFFDMLHSNNAARIRLWLALKEGMSNQIETRMVSYSDLKTESFLAVNPLGKVPALIRSDGGKVIESHVILEYLEDKYSDQLPQFKPATPEGRQLMNLMMRIHDIYISSPNCTAPGFSHSQGAMYLSYGWHGEARGMDLKTRAAKIAEIWQRLAWLDSHIVGPYLCGSEVTLADFTWFPTTIFMEFLLPRVFDWPNIFRDQDSPFPALSSWWLKIVTEPAFADVREQIYGYWEEMEAKGQFEPIKSELQADTDGLKFKYP